MRFCDAFSRAVLHSEDVNFCLLWESRCGWLPTCLSFDYVGCSINYIPPIDALDICQRESNTQRTKRQVLVQVCQKVSRWA